MKNVLLGTAICLPLVGMGYGQANNKRPVPSMMYSCAAETFLSVSVSTPKRDGIPQVQIKVTDPLSREQGMDTSGKRIPRSRYEDVVVAPKAPEHSREHAVEVCGAAQGEYALTVYEHGDGVYRLEVGVDVGDFLEVNLHSREDRVRQHRFRFTVRNEQVDLTWLDKDGRPEPALGGNVW